MDHLAHEPRLVDVGPGESLAVTSVGDGPVLLFSHGTPTWSYEWRHLVSALAGSYRCIAPDHLGFGRSPRPPGADYSPEAHARRFASLVEALGIERYTLVAHDFGGPFALEGAVERPDRVEGLVLTNTFAWSLADGPGKRLLVRMLGGPLTRWLYRNWNMSFKIARSAWGDRSTMTEDTWKPYEARFPDADSRERVLFALARSMAGSEDFFRSLERRLGRLAGKPAHLVWGMADRAFPRPHLEKFQRAWPRASVLELPGIGHWPHEERPREFIESMRRFLDETAVRGTAEATR